MDEAATLIEILNRLTERRGPLVDAGILDALASKLARDRPKDETLQQIATRARKRYRELERSFTENPDKLPVEVEFVIKTVDQQLRLIGGKYLTPAMIVATGRMVAYEAGSMKKLAEGIEIAQSLLGSAARDESLRLYPEPMSDEEYVRAEEDLARRRGE